MHTYRCTLFECGSRILGAAAGLRTIYAVHKIRSFVCIYRCALFYIYCRLLPARYMYTYRCALFEDAARIYSVRLGCAFFLKKNKKKGRKRGGKDTHKTGAFKYTYRCALFRIFCRQQCIIYMHTLGCAFFLIYTLHFPAYIMHTLMYTQKDCQNVPARVCTLWGRQANQGAAAGCGQI